MQLVERVFDTDDLRCLGVKDALLSTASISTWNFWRTLYNK